MTAQPDGLTFSQRLKAKQQQAAPVPAQRPAAVIEGDNPRAQRWAQRKLEETCAQISAEPEGGRNHALNAAAYSLGRLIPKWLEEWDTADRLALAAVAAGLSQVEARRTIQSGINAGRLDPRDPPVDNSDDDGWAVFGVEQTATATPVTESASETAEAVGIEPFHGLDLHALSQPLPPLDWLVQGRMTRNTLTLLGSKPGIGKSWLAQSMALEVARGGTWLGHDAMQGRVLYLDAENGDRLTLRRLQQLGAQQHDVDDRLLYVTESMVFPTPRDDLRLRMTLQVHQPDLVIVDTLASIAPTAEAGTEEASTFLAKVWHACRDMGAAMLLLCHLRKVQQGAGKDDPLASFRGAGHLVGAAHRAWVLDPIGNEKFILRDVKTREFAAVPPVRLRLVDSGEGDELRTDLEVEGTVAQIEDGYDAFLANVLTFIRRHPTGVAKTKDVIALCSSEPVRTVERWLERALAVGVLDKPGRGQWRIADEHLEGTEEDRK